MPSKEHRSYQLAKNIVKHQEYGVMRGSCVVTPCKMNVAMPHDVACSMVNPRKAYPIDMGLIPVFDPTGRATLGQATL